MQDAKQLFFSRLPQMTKYFVMRECENIPTWISLSGDLAFCHQDGIYGFKFPKRFSELSQEKTSLYSPLFSFIGFIYFIDPNHLKNLIVDPSVPTYIIR